MNSKIDHLEDKEFGLLKVIRKNRPDAYGNTYWWVKCKCGKEKEITGRSLIYLKSSHCGCLRTKKLTKHELEYKEIPDTSRNFKDISNITFGDLTAKRPVKKNAKGEWYWECECSCGNKIEARGSHLRNGSIRSCGCYKNNFRTTHGMTYTKEYTHIRNKKRVLQEKYLDTDWDVEKEVFLRRLFDTCVVCGMTEQEHQETYGQSLHVDHVRPLKDGFGLSVGNATILCQHCNRTKSDRALEDLPDHMCERILLSADLFQFMWEIS